MPLMQVHDRLHNRQPQAGAAFGPGAAAIGAIKALEQVRQMMGFDTAPRIAHRQRHTLVVAFHQQQYAGGTRGMANGIGQQVGNSALDHQAVPRYPGVAAQAQGDVLVLGAEGEQRHHPLRFLCQRHRGKLGPRRRVADLSQEQHVGDHPRQALHFLGTGFQAGLVFLRGPFTGQGHLRLAHQVGQRCAQLVGEVVGELRQLLHAGIEAVQHEVDALGQFAQLLGQVVQLQAMGQVLGADLGRHAAELLQRREPALHQPPRAHADQDQQHRQGDHRGTQVGTEQRFVVGAIQRQQHTHVFATAQRHQAGGAEDAIALAVDPVQVRQGVAGGHVQQQRLLRFGTDAQQHRRIRSCADDGQVDVVVAHHQVQQRMGAVADVVGVEALAEAVLQLLHFVFQAFARELVQLVGQGQVRQGRQ
ncbi:hypothetical protein ALQ38_05537 [Pseudomonas marginalis pv. marginalis]|nr:hypothetical protein ALQ38_05537 [Pseudomonas marginalis pv. marginalis]